MKCPHCGLEIISSRKRKPAIDAEPIDTLSMPESEMRAYFKRTAPLEDVRFWIRHANGSIDLMNQFRLLESEIADGTLTNRAEIVRRYESLKAAWRAERNPRRVWTEDEFWRAWKPMLRRIAGSEYRTLADHVRSNVRRAAEVPGRRWYGSDYGATEYETIAESVRDLVRAARKLVPYAPVFNHEPRPARRREVA